jgi:hypothetical protein
MKGNAIIRTTIPIGLLSLVMSLPVKACDQVLQFLPSSPNLPKDALCFDDTKMTAVWAQHSFVMDDVLGNDGQPYFPDDRSNGEDNRRYNRTYSIGGHQVVRNYQAFPFSTSRQIRSFNKALPTDYGNNPEYIRGLLIGRDFVPNQPDFQRRIISMANTVPMTPRFKEEKWQAMNQTALNILKAFPESRIHTVTGTLYDNQFSRFENGRTVNGVNRRVAIPDAYFFLYFVENPKRMFALMVPRKDSQRALKNYALPVDEVERLSGYDFFSWLDDSDELVLERSVGYIDPYLPKSSSGEQADLGKALMSIFD